MSYILPNFKVTLLLQTDLENLNIVLDNSNYSFNFLGNIWDSLSIFLVKYTYLKTRASIFLSIPTYINHKVFFLGFKYCSLDYTSTSRFLLEAWNAQAWLGSLCPQLGSENFCLNYRLVKKHCWKVIKASQISSSLVQDWNEIETKEYRRFERNIL